MSVQEQQLKKQLKKTTKKTTTIYRYDFDQFIGITVSLLCANIL